MRFIFFVITFASIHERVLPLIEEKKDKGEIIIVATTEPLELFFKSVTNFKVIRTKVHPDLISKKTTHKIIFNILRSKLEFKELFDGIENSEIYFTNKSAAIVIYSYIKKLSKKNKVIFFESESTKIPMTFPKEEGIKGFIMKWIAKWFLGVETVVYSRMGVPFWSLDEKFFENVSIVKVPPPSKEVTSKYLSNLNMLNGKEILIVINDSISCGFVEKTEFINKVNMLVDILNETKHGAYVVKPHPRLNKLYGKMAECKDVIPPYIPVQFILNHDWRYVIGFDSGSLISAVENTKARVISLMDAVEYTDANLKKTFRDNLVNNSQNKIQFLKDINELRNILK